MHWTYMHVEPMHLITSIVLASLSCLTIPRNSAPTCPLFKYIWICWCRQSTTCKPVVGTMDASWKWRTSYKCLGVCHSHEIIVYRAHIYIVTILWVLQTHQTDALSPRKKQARISEVVTAVRRQLILGTRTPPNRLSIRRARVGGLPHAISSVQWLRGYTVHARAPW